MSKEKNIIGYFSTKPTWRITIANKYKKEFTHDLAIDYLLREVLESVDREMDHINGSNSFYSGVRFLFPEVNHLAHLYWGHKGKEWRAKEKRLVIRFMNKFGIFKPESGIYYEVFRHGLMHSHHPKWISKDGKVVNWYIHTSIKYTHFGISLPDFTYQVKISINQFIKELMKEKQAKKTTRLDKFADAIIDCGTIQKRRDLGIKNKKRKKCE